MPAKANVHINNYPKIEDERQLAKGFAVMSTFRGQYFASSTVEPILSVIRTSPTINHQQLEM
jgi:hypothetical protein